MPKVRVLYNGDPLSLPFSDDADKTLVSYARFRQWTDALIPVDYYKECSLDVAASL